MTEILAILIAVLVTTPTTQVSLIQTKDRATVRSSGQGAAYIVLAVIPYANIDSMNNWPIRCYT